jgi:hypothetical protein
MFCGILGRSLIEFQKVPLTFLQCVNSTFYILITSLGVLLESDQYEDKTSTDVRLAFLFQKVTK